MDCKVMKKVLLFLFILFFTHATALEFDGKFIQGHFIIGKTDPNTNIIIDKKKLKFLKMDTLLLELEKIENLTS